MEEREHTFREAVIAVIKFLSAVLLLSIFILLIFFEVEFSVSNYDIFLSCRFGPDVYYGIDYKSRFEIWKIKRKPDHGSIVHQIYPF